MLAHLHFLVRTVIAITLVPAAATWHLGSCSNLLILIPVLSSHAFFLLQPEGSASELTQAPGGLRKALKPGVLVLPSLQTAGQLLRAQCGAQHRA
ncbi:uncharacterized protein LOC117803782 isoform X2 [Ailuropoda melanoleuca]|uniref:uncharacterized protein LOC117803782 isoform X2 n=1 Tax=Ailuropoda melanoleuca TaxID=9646 RepID=UPI00149414A9|nr:uncharacterized protein LOC117803782 isoform X2 [Ailuropoda melanoleuca]